MNGEIVPCLICARYKGGSAAGRGRYGRFHYIWYICVEGGMRVCLCVGGAVCVCERAVSVCTIMYVGGGGGV